MTRIQQVHWQLQQDYIGHPYYVTGHAIATAVGQGLSDADQAALHASHGMFVPGEYGKYPSGYSQNRYQAYMGTALQPVEAYTDLFLFRRPGQPWLLSSRPRDARNTHDVRVHSGAPAFAAEHSFARPAGHQQSRMTVSWYVSAYLHADDPAVLPLEESVLDGLQFGGKRNYGYGEMELVDSQVIDLDALDYSRLEAAEDCRIELVTPFVVQSEYPNADDMDIPWWWNVETSTALRRRAEMLVESGDNYELETIDHGQFVGYAGDRPVETAKAGVCRVGTHSKFGFGELRVVPEESAESSA